MKDMMKAAQVMGEFQKDPDKLKEYVPFLVRFFATILKSANAHHFNGHATIMMDIREGQPLLHLVNVDPTGTIESKQKIWLSDFLQNINLKALPPVVVNLANGEMLPWSEMQKQLFPNSIPTPATAIEAQPEPAPVKTLEGMMMDQATESYTWEAIEPRLPGEYSRGTCETIALGLKIGYSDEEIDFVLKKLKEQESWSAEMYTAWAKGIYFQEDDQMEMVEHIVTLLHNPPTHNPTENEPLHPGTDALGEENPNF